MIGPEIAITIRPETAGDAPKIHRVVQAAFRDVPESDGSEPELVDRLRRDGDLALSLVAEDGERIVGHIAFSPVTIDGEASGWFGLAPVSVLPEVQRMGIGSALIRRGIADLRERAVSGLVVLGSPDYYAHFGFVPNDALRYPGAPAEYFQAKALEGRVPPGEVKYARAFDPNDSSPA